MEMIKGRHDQITVCVATMAAQWRSIHKAPYKCVIFCRIIRQKKGKNKTDVATTPKDCQTAIYYFFVGVDTL